MKITNRQSGFTAIELLITLFIAAAFLMSGFQLYNLIIKDGGQTRAQAHASNVAYDYLQRYKPFATNPCTPQTPLTNLAITVASLSNVTVTVIISCPYGITSSTSKVIVNVQYSVPPQTISQATFVTPVCLTGFIPVPGSITYGTSDFCVMKYEASHSDTVGTVQGTSTTPASQANAVPWVNVPQELAGANNDAKEYSANVAGCTGCHLITEAEWLTIAQNVLSVPSNWNGGVVGTSYIYSGHNDIVPNNALEASTNDSDGYYGTGNVAPSNQRRTLTLTNGEVIWDLAGNVREWTSGTVQSPTIQPGGAGYTCREWNAATTGTLPVNPFPSFGTPAASGWNATINGIGRLCSSSDDTLLRGFLRGGDWIIGSYAGVLTLYLSTLPSNASNNIGFRVSQ